MQVRERVTLTGRLGAFVAGLRYEDLPADVAGRAKSAVLDTLGAALAGAGTELLPKKDVVNSCIAQRGRESLAVELWVEPAERRGAHIGERVDVMLAQQLDKALRRMF